MEPRQPKGWTKERWVSIGVFAGFSLFNLMLMCAGGVLCMFSLGPPGRLSFGELWLWVVALPAMATKEVDWTLANLLMIANPFLYGGMGWFAWRMWKLMRGKRPAE